MLFIYISFLFQDEIQAYGIDLDGPLPDDHSDDGNLVEIPRTLIPLETTDYQEMCAAIDPLKPSDSYGIDIYMDVITFITGRVATGNQ